MGKSQGSRPPHRAQKMVRMMTGLVLALLASAMTMGFQPLIGDGAEKEPLEQRSSQSQRAFGPCLSDQTSAAGSEAKSVRLKMKCTFRRSVSSLAFTPDASSQQSGSAFFGRNGRRVGRMTGVRGGVPCEAVRRHDSSGIVCKSAGDEPVQLGREIRVRLEVPKPPTEVASCSIELLALFGLSGPSELHDRRTASLFVRYC